MSVPLVTGDVAVRNRWKVFAVLASTAALTILDVSKLGIALPAIQADMGGAPATVQFMLVGYTLAYAAMLLPAGRIGDVLPRRRVFLIGSVVFVAASIACTFAPTIEWLVTARIIEGLGAGLLMPQVLGLIQQIFPAGERAKPLAALAAITSVTSLAAPVLAGFILDVAGDSLGWRLLFLVTVVAGAVIIPFAVVLVREPPVERRKGFDGIGAVLLTGAVVFTIAPISAGSDSLALSPWAIGSMGAGVTLFVFFALHEKRLRRRGREPLVDPTLFSLPHLPSGVLISGCMHAAATAGTLIVTIGLQQIGNQSALSTALWMLPSAVASLLGAWLATRVAPTNGTVVMIGTGMGAVALIGMGFAFGVAPASTMPWLIAGLLGVSSFGSGLAAPANQARALLYAPGHRASIAGSLIQFAQRTGSAIGMAAALAIYYGFFAMPTFAGQPASGPMLALWAVAGFLVAATVIAILDRVRATSTLTAASAAPAVERA